MLFILIITRQFQLLFICMTVYSTSGTVIFGKVFYELMRNTQRHAALVCYCQLAVFGHL